MPNSNLARTLTKAEIITASRLYEQKRRFKNNQALVETFNLKIESVISNFLTEIRNNRNFVLEVMSVLTESHKSSNLAKFWSVEGYGFPNFLKDVVCVLQTNSGEIQEEEIFLFTEILVKEEDKEDFFKILFEILEVSIKKFQSID